MFFTFFHIFFVLSSYFSDIVDYHKINLSIGGVMKRAVVSVAALLSLSLTVPAFAAEATQPSAGTGANYEQMKADHLKRIDNRINSLQEEKTCVQAAKNQEELKACWMKHKSQMKEHRDDMRKGRGGPGGPAGSVPPQQN
jgi:hypothetical protein